MVRALDAGAVTATQVPEVLRQWRNPEHLAFQERTAWSLFNACTHACRGGSVWLVSRRTQALHGVFDAHCGLLDREGRTQLQAA